MYIWMELTDRGGLNMDQESYTIGEFARLMGVSPRTVDFYTRMGLLHPIQNGKGHGYRRFTEEHRRRVSVIKQLQARKFSLQEIRELLDSSQEKEGSSAVEVLEQVALDLEKLQLQVEQTRKETFPLNQTAMRAVATEALRKATALTSILVTMLQDLPSI